MVEIVSPGEDDVDPANRWEAAWEAEDFSWDGLKEKQRWGTGAGSGLQDFIRGVEGGKSDTELLELGRLLVVPGKGIYHVSFIPRKWTSLQDFPMSPSDFDSAKALFWSLARSRHLPDSFRGRITGVRLPNTVSGDLIGSTKASFAWCSLLSQVVGPLDRGTRGFENCYFPASTRVRGFVEAPTSSAFKFESCIFDEELKFSELVGAKEILLTDCTIPLLGIEHCEVGELYVDTCGLGRLSFDKSKFSGNVSFSLCEISEGIEAYAVSFGGDLEFVETAISKSFDLIRCDFKDRVTFADVSWPALRAGSASASGSRFDALVIFSSAGPPPIQFFDEAEFRGDLALSRYTEAQWRSALDEELGAWSSGQHPAESPLQHARSIEAGCRNLRKISEQRADVQAEHFWHRAELISRRRRGDSTITEKGFSVIYGVVADYGLSISRPFISLSISILFFSFVYAAISTGLRLSASVDWRALEQGFGYSLNRTIPIGVFSNDQNVWRSDLLGSGGDLWSISTRALATFQSVLSAVFVYLGVMSIRRKFKIG